MSTFGPAVLRFIERLSSLRRLKCTSMIEKGPPLYRSCPLFGGQNVHV